MSIKDQVEDLYPLSPIQQGMLFHSIYEPESSVYFVQKVFTLKGEMNVCAFEHAWEQVIRRHSILRTAFIWEELEEPVQVAHYDVDLEFQQHDWRSLSESEQRETLKARLREDRIRGFDFARAPLMRLLLALLDNNRAKFVWTYHHLLLDGWSSSLVLNEVLSFYEAFCNNVDLEARPPRPFRDYIAWLQRQDVQQAELFWRQRLKGLRAPTSLGIDHVPARGDGPDHYEEREVSISIPTTEALRLLARQQRLTLSTLVHGAWALLLSRYGNAEDVLFGSVVSGRPADLEDAQSILGVFINTLPIRAHVKEEDLLVPWLNRLQIQQVEARQFEYSPLLDIHRWSELPQASRLFESILAFENYPVSESLRTKIRNLEVEDVRSFQRTGYPITVTAVPGSELLIIISWDRHRFDPGSTDRVLGHLKQLLDTFAADLQRRLCEISLLTSAERHQLLVTFNNTGYDYPRHESYHSIFQAVAAKQPEATAVVFQQEHLTYGGLNARSNHLARYLQSLGIGPEGLVALCIERSIDLVVALLGILKAGGAYLPLDPTHARERLASILEDAQPRVLVTRSNLLTELPSTSCKVAFVDTDWPAMACHSDSNPLGGVVPENPAYVIYTSGSTGRPKGVAVPHRGLVNYLSWCVRSYSVSEGRGSLVHTPIGSDLTITSLLSPMFVGRRVVLVPEGQGIAGLGVVLRDESDLSFIKITPSHLGVLNQIASEEGISIPARRVIVGGEALHAENIAWLRLNNSQIRIVNEYGPTEAVVGCSVYEDAGAQTLTGAMPIGRPISNVEIYVLDAHSRPVPVNVPGEIYIGGEGLARGYLDRPDLTADKFTPNPFGSTAGARLYKSGDLVRHLPVGNIEYLGRIDDQVKISGFRIEPGEVEVALRLHSCVRDAVVVAREDDPGTKRLVAYIVADDRRPLAGSDLREFLKQKLPQYMVPSRFVMLAALPLTPNGKVDKRALPAPDQECLDLGTTFVSPRMPLEETIARIWSEVLHIERVGIYDNFFELGGHSLLATRLLSRLRTALEVDLPLRSIFDSPTVADLAVTIVQARADMAGDEHINQLLAEVESV
jgi:surfactin family lipopeptide synthetase C